MPFKGRKCGERFTMLYQVGSLSLFMVETCLRFLYNVDKYVVWDCGELLVRNNLAIWVVRLFFAVRERVPEGG